MLERRGIVRIDCSLSGEILLSGRPSIRCMVRNVSERGAKIVVSAGAAIPHKFRLRAAELGLDIEARIAWRNGSDLGVMFPLEPKSME